MVVDDYDKVVAKEKRLGLVPTYVIPAFVSFLLVLILYALTLYVCQDSVFGMEYCLNSTLQYLTMEHGLVFHPAVFLIIFAAYVPFFFLVYRFKGIKRERSMTAYFKKLGFERGVIRYTTFDRLLHRYLIFLIVISVVVGFGISYVMDMINDENERKAALLRLDKIKPEELKKEAEQAASDLSLEQLQTATFKLKSESFASQLYKLSDADLKLQAHNSVDKLTYYYSLSNVATLLQMTSLFQGYATLSDDEIKQQLHDSINEMSGALLFDVSSYLALQSLFQEYDALSDDEIKQQAYQYIDKLSDFSLTYAVIYPSGYYLISETEGLTSPELKQQARNSIDVLSGYSLKATTQNLAYDQVRKDLETLSDEGLKQQSHKYIAELHGDLLKESLARMRVELDRNESTLTADDLKQQSYTLIDSLSADSLKKLEKENQDLFLDYLYDLKQSQLLEEYSKTIHEVDPDSLRENLKEIKSAQFTQSESSGNLFFNKQLIAPSLEPIVHFSLALTYIPIAMVYSVFFYKFILVRDDEFEYNFCIGCFKIITNFEQLSEVQKRKYMVRGLKHYEKYIRKNFNMNIRNFESIISKIMLLDIEFVQQLASSSLENLEKGNKLNLLNYLNSNYGSNDGNLLISYPFSQKIKDWAQPLFIPAIGGLIGALKFITDFFK